ncbi:uncharacterized protein LOC132935234 isoform X1 [Metopolophium dirhodum]|uniref:uncharacterized protein LOC132935234 isoform X1 n=1 Tax=Metopolophium dirhodum TaxID=44670 RepID=UPI0029904C2F|nr:uncharacterized protein LOC132935234 isoform X1 [Metopolophium dirhodum]
MNSTFKIPEYATVDFEFCSYNRDHLILISGAIMGRYQPGIITKLEGRALHLQENRAVTDQEWKHLVKHLQYIFKDKLNLLYPVLAQLYDSDHTVSPNLTQPRIKQQLDKYDAILTWEGSTDKQILQLLDITKPIFSLRGWDLHMDGNFVLLITDYGDNQPIASIPIGKYRKNGRSLKLNEAHTLMCSDLYFHGGLEAHDPRADVQWTRCLFLQIYKKHRDIINEAVWAKQEKKRNILPAPI